MEEEIPRNEEDIGPEVLMEEVRAAIKELKNNNNASGIDNIPAEMLKSLEEGVMTELTRICQDNGSVARGLLTIHHHTN